MGAAILELLEANEIHLEHALVSDDDLLAACGQLARAHLKRNVSNRVSAVREAAAAP
jgi:hypothetical protein